MSDAKAKFEAALAMRKNQKIAEASGGGFSGGSGLPDIPYAPLKTEKQQAFQFAGLPYVIREKPTDSKRIHVAMILGDNDKKFRCIGPDPQEKKDWILYRVMSKVLQKHWDKTLPGDSGQLGKYVYDYATQHPELFNRVSKNNNLENTLEKGWRFNPFVLFNVIDLHNYAWHTENKKFKVLSKKASEYQDKVWFEPGVPDALYTAIMDDIVAVDGNTEWTEYPIVVCKIKQQPWYKVYHGVDDLKKLDDDVKAVLTNRKGGLTADEATWEMNDFDKLYPITSYRRIKSCLGIFFQKVDKVFNTKYYDELVALVEKEEAELAEKQMQAPVDNEEVMPTETTSTVSEQQPQATATPAATTVIGATTAESSAPPTRGTAQSVADYVPMTDEIWQKLADGTFNGKKYIGVPLMSPEEKAYAIGVKSDGSFVWKPEAGQLYEGASSKFISPEAVTIDPLNGEKLV